MNAFRLVIACSLALWAALLGVGTADATPADVHYALTASIPGPDGPWDYMSIDAVANRLYMSHNGAATFDLATHNWERTLDRGARVSEVLPLRPLNRLIFSEGSSASVVIVDLSTHRILGRVDTGIGPDGMTFRLDGEEQT